MQRIKDWDEAQALLGRGQPIIAPIHFKAGAHVIIIRGFTRDGKVVVNDPPERGDAGSARKVDELRRTWLDSGGFALQPAVIDAMVASGGILQQQVTCFVQY